MSENDLDPRINRQKGRDMLSEKMQELDELRTAARAVVQTWEHGDLAEAVRELDAVLTAPTDVDLSEDESENDHGHASV